jgi:hypothetical protein
LLAKRVAQNFDRQFKKGGMSGIKNSVESCYALARKTLKESTIEYCYLLDQLASAVDAAAMEGLNRPQDEYWRPRTALARTMTLVRTNPEKYSRTLQHWADIGLLSLKELAALTGGPR